MNFCISSLQRKVRNVYFGIANTYTTPYLKGKIYILVLLYITYNNFWKLVYFILFIFWPFCAHLTGHQVRDTGQMTQTGIEPRGRKYAMCPLPGEPLRCPTFIKTV